jgi:hypothetical protein
MIRDGIIIIIITMAFINNNNEIITAYLYPQSNNTICVINDTNFLPLSVYRNIILMSDGMLYIIINKGYGRCILEVLEMNTNKLEQYAGKVSDFTDRFVKINKRCYELQLHTRKLCKIPIVAKNSNNVANSFKSYDIYYYVTINNELMCLDKSNNLQKNLDDNVDTILLHHVASHNRNCIIYKKNDMITCSEYYYCRVINSYVIDYDGSPIIKTLDYFVLDSDGNLHKFVSNGHLFVIKKVLGNVVDFNISNEILHVLKTDYQMYQIDCHNYSVSHVREAGSFFRKIICNKSANKTM